MKKITFSDFEKNHVKKSSRRLGWLSFCLMLLFGQFATMYGANILPKQGISSTSGTGVLGVGDTCLTPLTITALPYSHTGNTATYGNDYSEVDVPPTAPNAVNTGSSSGSIYYLGGFEVVYSITPLINGVININTTNTDEWVSLWAFTGCSFASTVGLHTTTSGTSRNITGLPVLANTTYYIVISNWNAPGVDYTLNVTGTDGLLAPLDACTGMPTAGTASLSSSNGNAGASIIANVTGATSASGLTYQWQKSVEGTWQDIAGATTISSTFNADSGAVGTVIDYRLKVTCTPSAEIAYSTVTSYTISLTYCVPTGGGNNGDEIVNFTLSNLNNTSTPSDGVAGYKNYSGTVAPAQISLAVPYSPSISSGTGSGNHGAAIWIDYNQNGTFEAIEKVSFITSSIAANSTANFPEFIVPEGTALGTYRLRVQYHYAKSGELLDPCTITSTYAETEDYNIQVMPVPTCVQPSALTVLNVTDTSADLAWTSTGSSFIIEWGVENFTQGSGTTVTSTSATYALTGLTANTKYSYYVRQDCGTTDGLSLCTGPYKFKTACGSVTSFFENFDTSATGTTSAMPSCWERAGNGSTYVTTGSVAPNSPANRLYMSANGSTTNPTQGFTIMPAVSNLQAATHRLKFKAYASSLNKSMEIGYFTNLTDLSSFVLIESIALPGSVAANTEEFAVEPTGIPAGISNLVFRNNAPGVSVTVYIDDVSWEQIPLCPDITLIQTDVVSSSTATIIYEPGGSETAWEYVYGPAATTTSPDGLTPVAVSNNPMFDLTGLTGNTIYSVWIRSTCEAGIGNWPQTPFKFRTLCDAVTSFAENFDSYTLVGASNPLPDCWSRFGSTGFSYITTGSATPMSPGNRLYLNANATTSPDAIAVMPPVSNLQAGTHRLRFKAFSTTAEKSLEIGYFDYPGDVESFVVLEAFELPGTTISTAIDFNYTPEFIPDGIQSLAFRNHGPAFTGTTTIYVDDVVWELLPACFDITEITFANINATSVDVEFNPGGSETAWQYVVASSTVSSPVGLTPVSVTNNPYITITELTPSTSYNLWIRSNCGSGSFGNWSAVQLFTTACGETETFTENFDSSLTGSVNPLPLCWTRAGNGSTYVSSGGGLPGTAPNRLYMFASGTSSSQAVAIMPAVSNLQANTHRLKFTAYASIANRTLEIGYFTDSADLTTFNLLETFTLPGTSVSTAQIFTFNPSNVPVGINKLAFRNIGVAGGSTTAYIDDVIWEAQPTTVPSCATDVVATPNATCGNFATVLTWNVNPQTDGYYLSIGTTAGGVDVLNNEDVGLITTYNLIGELSTTYYYTVTPYNNVGSATGCVEQSFTTFNVGCYCTSNPTSNDGAGISNVQLSTQDFPNGDVTYFDHTATVVDMAQGVNSNLQITFATGYTYGTNVWIDLNDNYTFEESELVFSGESTNANPTTLNASFLMPVNAPLGNHRMRIVATDVVQNPANPCYNGSYGITLEFKVNVTVAPTCLAPTDLAIEPATLSGNGVTLIWNPATTPATEGYDYYYSTSSTFPTASTTPSGSVAAGVTTVALTGLTSVTPYYAWVRSKCSTIETSMWSNSVSFTTPCSSYDAPFTEDFTTFLPNCWSRSSAGTVETGPTNTSNGIWAADGFLNDTTTGSARVNLYSSDRIGWLITPVISTVIGQQHTFTFNYGITAFSGTTLVAMGSDDFVKVVMSTDNGVTWTEIENFTVASNVTNTSQDYEYLFTATSAQVKFAFIASDGPVNDLEDYNFYVDNVSVMNLLSNTDFKNNSFTAYPNPVKDVLNIRYNETISDVRVFNLLGQQLFSRRINATEGKVDMSNLPSGTYLVRATSGDKVQTIKVIKQ